MTEKPRPPRLRMRALDYIHARAVVVEEIEVDGGETGQRMAEVAHRRDGLQENFGQHHGRTDVQINAAIVQLAQQGAEEAEIVVRGAPMAAPSAAGWVCGVSVPMATWTVTGVRLRRQAWSRMLRRGASGSAISSSRRAQRFAHADALIAGVLRCA